MASILSGNSLKLTVQCSIPSRGQTGSRVNLAPNTMSTVGSFPEDEAVEV